jgi:hypothetical protein
MVKVPIILGPDCFQSPEVGAFEISMQCSLFFFHNIWCWLCESQHTSGISGSWPQGLLNVKHLGAPMTKLEWREIAPPCEKKSHLRLSITFHLSCRQIQLHSVHVSCDFEFWMFGRLMWRTYFFRMAGFHNVYFCDDCLAIWYNLLSPSLLYQRSVKRSHVIHHRTNPQTHNVEFGPG